MSFNIKYSMYFKLSVSNRILFYSASTTVPQLWLQYSHKMQLYRLSLEAAHASFPHRFAYKQLQCSI